MGDKAHDAVQAARTFSEHLGAVGENLGFSNFHPTIAYDHLSKAKEMLPKMPDAYNAITTVAAKAAEAAKYLKDIDYTPAYSAMLNFADNFARDEIAMTAGVIVAFAGGIYCAGAYVGSMWIDRGIPGVFTRWKMNYGARQNRTFYRENPDVILGKDVYGILEEHFKKKDKQQE